MCLHNSLFPDFKNLPILLPTPTHITPILHYVLSGLLPIFRHPGYSINGMIPDQSFQNVNFSRFYIIIDFIENLLIWRLFRCKMRHILNSILNAQIHHVNEFFNTYYIFENLEKMVSKSEG